ncbi:hypothetical protein GcC1_206031 [Golovinomyces cichoracearum]|uniref:CCHC-type domain-containing protein n=1 Tax=Golovinomyces cichoracearum TaxID=62708 RepID=A0A420HCD4_9PEZI|nr:hypothetical protein GcC1_206031 [Golovinomyces cichoracearum]
MSWDNTDTAGAKASEWDTNNYDAGGYDAKENTNADYDGDNWNQEKNSGDNAYGDNAAGGGAECYACGEIGHRKADCPNPAVPREFTGTCRICEKEGHRAAECPDKPVSVCRNCQEEGHEAFGCENPRKINRDHVKDMTGEEAWALMKTAIEERDLDDLKEAVEIYIKSNPEITYQMLEKKLRDESMGVYIIALEKELAASYTNMDIQGNLDKTYTVTWRWSPKPLRPKERQFWPSSPQENFDRLNDAGEPIDRGVPKCNNCNELGHTRKKCPEEIVENVERATVLCFNCNQTGHRVRDCPEPRTDRFACKNCNQSGHTARECPEPRSLEGVECNKCHENGHYSRDCPLQGAGGGGTCHNCGQEGHRKSDCPNETALICRNCDAIGHISRECPLPRDYSRVKCQNCQQMGHTKVRCTEPLKENEDAGYGDAGYGGDNNYEADKGADTTHENNAEGDGWGWNDNTAGTTTNQDWEGEVKVSTSGADW